MRNCATRFLLTSVIVGAVCTTLLSSARDRKSSAGPRPRSASNARPSAKFFVAPDGSQDGDGSKKRPWNLALALSHPTVVKPGDTIILRGGTYSGSFTSYLTGTPEAPITVRQYSGERTTIDGGGFDADTLEIRGAYTNYRDFEVTNSRANRAADGPHPHAVFILGHHVKCINMIIHEGGNGVGFWAPAIDSELYGNIIYNNGWLDATKDRGSTGYGIYSQNELGTKLVRDNLWFNNYSYGFHAYGQSGQVNGYALEGNVAFNNGSPANVQAPQIHFKQTHYPMERISVVQNFTYHRLQHPDGSFGDGMSFAPASPSPNLIVKDNYFAGGRYLLQVENADTATITGNTFYGLGYLVRLIQVRDIGFTGLTVDNNTYYHTLSAPFILEDSQTGGSTSYTFSGWRSPTGFDRNSKYLEGPPPNAVFVRPNQYEPGRAHIIVFNWKRKEKIMVDVSSVLSVGTIYEVRNSQDYFGAPVLSGTYDGKLLQLPMTGLKVVKPVVGHEIAYEPADLEFNVFVLMQR